MYLATTSEFSSSSRNPLVSSPQKEMVRMWVSFLVVSKVRGFNNRLLTCALLEQVSELVQRVITVRLKTRHGVNSFDEFWYLV